MELIEVTARFDTEGRVTPLQIAWKGSLVPIDSTGRRWEAEDGQHILAMLPGDRVIELVFKPVESRWYLRPLGAGGRLA
jgi:hypothetical protein